MRILDWLATSQAALAPWIVLLAIAGTDYFARDLGRHEKRRPISQPSVVSISPSDEMVLGAIRKQMEINRGQGSHR